MIIAGARPQWELASRRGWRRAVRKMVRLPVTVYRHRSIQKARSESVSGEAL